MVEIERVDERNWARGMAKEVGWSAGVLGWVKCAQTCSTKNRSFGGTKPYFEPGFFSMGKLLGWTEYAPWCVDCVVLRWQGLV